MKNDCVEFMSIDYNNIYRVVCSYIGFVVTAVIKSEWNVCIRVCLEFSAAISDQDQSA